MASAIRRLFRKLSSHSLRHRVSKSNSELYEIDRVSAYSAQTLPAQRLQLPRDPSAVVKAKHNTVPRQLPREDADYEEVRYFLYSVLTAKVFGCAKICPQWVLETCWAWHGNGRELLCMSESELMLMCPLRAGAARINPERYRTELMPPPYAREMIGKAVVATLNERRKATSADQRRIQQEWETELTRSCWKKPSIGSMSHARRAQQKPAQKALLERPNFYQVSEDYTASHTQSQGSQSNPNWVECTSRPWYGRLEETCPSSSREMYSSDTGPVIISAPTIATPVEQALVRPVRLAVSSRAASMIRCSSRSTTRSESLSKTTPPTSEDSSSDVIDKTTRAKLSMSSSTIFLAPKTYVDGLSSPRSYDALSAEVQRRRSSQERSTLRRYRSISHMSKSHYPVESPLFQSQGQDTILPRSTSTSNAAGKPISRQHESPLTNNAALNLTSSRVASARSRRHESDTSVAMLLPSTVIDDRSSIFYRAPEGRRIVDGPQIHHSGDCNRAVLPARQPASPSTVCHRASPDINPNIQSKHATAQRPYHVGHIPSPVSLSHVQADRLDRMNRPNIRTVRSAQFAEHLSPGFRTYSETFVDAPYYRPSQVHNPHVYDSGTSTLKRKRHLSVETRQPRNGSLRLQGRLSSDTVGSDRDVPARDARPAHLLHHRSNPAMSTMYSRTNIRQRTKTLFETIEEREILTGKPQRGLARETDSR